MTSGSSLPASTQVVVVRHQSSVAEIARATGDSGLVGDGEEGRSSLFGAEASASRGAEGEADDSPASLGDIFGEAADDDDDAQPPSPRQGASPPSSGRGTPSTAAGSVHEGDEGSDSGSPRGVAFGRRVGPQRGPPVDYYPEHALVRSLYRDAVREVLTSSSTSSRGGQFPDVADNLFLARVQALEELRTRPHTRGSPGRPGRPVDLPDVLDDLDVGAPTRRPWSVIPRGVASEWFPTMPERADDEVCVACSANQQTEEIRCRRRADAFDAYAIRNDWGFESADGLGPLTGGDRLLMSYPLTFHSCGSGRPLSLPMLMFNPREGHSA